MVGNDCVVSYFDTGNSVAPREELPSAGLTKYPGATGMSFARGAVVGLAVAIPVWALLILLVIR